jgi:gamma-glutamyltranspeptidase/glutathione hydrolase
MKPTGNPIQDRLRLLGVIAFWTAAVSTAPIAAEDGPSWAATGEHYMVATDHPLASAAGARILAEGGNAFDAAVAVSFALGVVRPYSTGIGGGGFALLMRPGEKPIAIDFRETAPAACSPDAYLDSAGTPIPRKTVHGPWAVGVPGTLKAAAHILARFGTMSLADVIAPALELAEEGFPVDSHTHRVMTELAEIMAKRPDYPARFAELRQTFLIEGKPYAMGDTLHRPQLGATLRLIAASGEAALYAPDGPLHVDLVDHMRHHNGPLRSDDLADYQVKTREPLAGNFDRYETWTMPPPSSGGAVITAVLNAVERFDLVAHGHSDVGELWPHFVVECFKHTFADRASALGDWDFDTTGEIHETVSRMLDTASASRIVMDIDPDRTRKSRHYGTGKLADDHGTSHFCVVDSNGNAVAWAETINLEFGSYEMIPGTGIVLNDQLDDFSLTAGVANQYGLIQSDRNLIGPGKRPLSSMSPTIVTFDGAPVLLAGGSGGPRIITGTLHVILNILELGMRADSAVAAPRFHHQWQPDIVRIEPELDAAILTGLLRRGHTVSLYPTSAGIVQMIDCRGNTLLGASDPRKGGRPAGR